LSRPALLASVALAFSSASFAQSASAPAPAKWDVSAPPGAKLRDVPIRVDEGSWMDVDVSPDGRTIAFTLLGDIYAMPIEGGAARRIAEGLAWEVQPRFSPDGKRIAFTSDRGGGDNIWIMDADGGNKRQLTKEEFRLVYQPSWSPDGRFIAAKKHFTTARSLGTGEIWLYHVDGGGGVALVKRASEQHQKELGEPSYSADGRAIFYTRNVTPGPIFEYAQDSNTALFAIERYDLTTGEVSTAATAQGGSVRPTPSPDGRKLAFVRRYAGKSKLFVRDLGSGAEREVYGALDRDAQETWAVTGVYPNMAWTPDSRSILFWAGGKIRRVDADGSNAREIPFRVEDSRQVAEAPHPQIEVAPERFTTRMPRFAEASPDGRQLVFESLGKLWVKPRSGGAAKRVTRDEAGFELFPSWSPDGRSLVYVDWTDAGLGSIRTIPAGGGAPRTLSTEPGHYARPRFSPDGHTIAFEKLAGGELTAPTWSDNPGVYRMPARGGAATRIAKDMGNPRFGAGNDRLFMVGTKAGKRQLVSTDLNGEAQRVHATGELANDFVVSPDGRHVAFRQNYQAFVMPLLPGGQDVSVDMKTGPLPVVKVSEAGADYIHWSQAGDELHWSTGATLSSVRASDLFAAGKPPTPATVSLAMEALSARPAGVVALTGARIVTMAAADGGAIDDGVIVIRGDRIAAVGRRGEVAVPAGATVVDMAGKTIIPGLVDAHAHGPQADAAIVPQQNWSLIQALALGTTTIHDPSAQASEIFAAAELQRTGRILAPRIFSTGNTVYGAKSIHGYAQIDKYEDALAHIRRLKAQGARSIKNYNQPRREQRQQVIAASRAEDMQVVAEGGSLFGLGITHIVDGNSTFEHNLPLDTFYKDVIDLWAGSTTNYTPTLVVTFGGLAGDPYWRQATNIFEHPLLKAHTPPALLREQGARRITAPESDFVDDESAREAKKLADRGVLVSIGAHGQQAGIAPHWELWSFVRGGMSPVQALAAGTITAAKSLGMARDIGSLEPGKLADLVVLDADPTADIRNSDKVHRVMLGGRLYDPLTMNEVATGSFKRQPYWWEKSAP
jgi:imidazolonepropionase-like amidohydrolase/Tol biopolymer transport system component